MLEVALPFGVAAVAPPYVKRPPTTRRRTAGGDAPRTATGILDLPAELLEHILVHLQANQFSTVAATSRAIFSCCSSATLMQRIQLEPQEDSAFLPARRRLLHSLANAGNATAAYRLGVALSYHPTARLCDNQEGHGILRRLARRQDTPSSLRADAAFECWLLTRRLPDPESAVCPDDCGRAAGGDWLLELAISLGHSAACFGQQNVCSHERESQPDFRVSTEHAVMQTSLRGALQLHVPNPATTSVCRSPHCGRWGVRARARACGVQGPPALPRCQGMMAGDYRARYCSRFCQALDWPEHRLTCSMHAMAHTDLSPTGPLASAAAVASTSSAP